MVLTKGDNSSPSSWQSGLEQLRADTHREIAKLRSDMQLAVDQCMAQCDTQVRGMNVSLAARHEADKLLEARLATWEGSRVSWENHFRDVYGHHNLLKLDYPKLERLEAEVQGLSSSIQRLSEQKVDSVHFEQSMADLRASVWAWKSTEWPRWQSTLPTRARRFCVSPTCYNELVDDADFCRKCGTKWEASKALPFDLFSPRSPLPLPANSLTDIGFLTPPRLHRPLTERPAYQRRFGNLSAYSP